MRLRVLDFGVDKYGLNAYIYDSTNDGDDELRQGPVLADEERRGRRSPTLAQGPVGRRQGHDRRRRRRGQDRRHARQGRGADARTCPGSACSTPPSRRAIASWPTWAGEPGFTGDFAEYVAAEVPDLDRRRLRDPRGRHHVSEETYVEQGLYWATGHQPMLEYVVKTYKPDLLLVGMPTTDEFQHQFLGLVSPEAARRRSRTRPTTTSSSTASPDGRVAAREGFLRTAYEEADETLTLARHADAATNPTTFVASDHGFAPQFLADRREQGARRPRPALEAADLELPAGHGRDDRQGQGLLGRRRRPDLPERRRPRSRPAAASQQVAADRCRPRPSPRSRPRSSASTDPNDWTARRQRRGLEGHRPRLHEGRGPLHPERAAAARPTWPIRPGPATSSCSPTRRTSSTRRRRARSSRRPTSSASTATCRTSRTWPPTSTCGRPSSPAAPGSPRAQVDARGRSTSRRRSPSSSASPSRSTARAASSSTCVKGGASYKPISIIGLTDFHGQLEPTTLAVRRRRTARRRRGRASRRCSTRSSPTCPAAGAAPRVRRQRRRLAAELGPARGHAGDRRRERVGPRRHVATATTSSTTASSGC